MHAWALASLRVLRAAWIARPVIIRRGSGAVNFICGAAFAVATHRRLRHAPTTGGRAPPMSQFLTLHEPPENLRRPIIIMAFSGWNDAAEAATTAARYLSQLWSSRPFASIDPEEFYHFGLSRPYVRFKPGSRTEREIIWPATEFSIAQPAELERDIIVGVAIEPHLKWRSYCAAVLE